MPRTNKRQRYKGNLPIYTVKNISDKREFPDGWKYLVHWEGEDPVNKSPWPPTWEPIENIQEDVPDIAKRFEKKQRKLALTKQRPFTLKHRESPIAQKPPDIQPSEISNAPLSTSDALLDISATLSNSKPNETTLEKPLVAQSALPLNLNNRPTSTDKPFMSLTVNTPSLTQPSLSSTRTETTQQSSSGPEPVTKMEVQKSPILTFMPRRSVIKLLSDDEDEEDDDDDNDGDGRSSTLKPYSRPVKALSSDDEEVNNVKRFSSEILELDDNSEEENMWHLPRRRREGHRKRILISDGESDSDSDISKEKKLAEVADNEGTLEHGYVQSDNDIGSSREGLNSHTKDNTESDLILMATTEDVEMIDIESLDPSDTAPLNYTSAGDSSVSSLGIQRSSITRNNSLTPLSDDLSEDAYQRKDTVGNEQNENAVIENVITNNDKPENEERGFEQTVGTALTQEQPNDHEITRDSGQEQPICKYTKRRTSRSFVMELPNRQYNWIFLSITITQKQIYDKILEDDYTKIADELAAGNGISRSELTKILKKLLQCLNNPNLDTQYVYSNLDDFRFQLSGKLVFLEELFKALDKELIVAILVTDLSMENTLSQMCELYRYPNQRLNTVLTGHPTGSARYGILLQAKKSKATRLLRLRLPENPEVDFAIIYDPHIHPTDPIFGQFRPKRSYKYIPTIQLVSAESAELAFVFSTLGRKGDFRHMSDLSIQELSRIIEYGNQNFIQEDEFGSKLMRRIIDEVAQWVDKGMKDFVGAEIQPLQNPDGQLIFNILSAYSDDLMIIQTLKTRVAELKSVAADESNDSMFAEKLNDNTTIRSNIDSVKRRRISEPEGTDNVISTITQQPITNHAISIQTPIILTPSLTLPVPKNPADAYHQSSVAIPSLPVSLPAFLPTPLIQQNPLNTPQQSLTSTNTPSISSTVSASAPPGVETPLLIQQDSPSGPEQLSSYQASVSVPAKEPLISPLVNTRTPLNDVYICQWTNCSQLRPTNNDLLQHVAEAHLNISVPSQVPSPPVASPFNIFDKFLHLKTMADIRNMVDSELSSQVGSESYRQFLKWNIQNLNAMSQNQIAQKAEIEKRDTLIKERDTQFKDLTAKFQELNSRYGMVQAESMAFKEKESSYIDQLGQLHNELKRLQRIYDAEKERVANIPAMIQSRTILEHDLVQLQSQLDAALAAKETAESSLQKVFSHNAELKAELKQVYDERARLKNIIDTLQIQHSQQSQNLEAQNNQLLSILRAQLMEEVPRLSFVD